MGAPRGRGVVVLVESKQQQHDHVGTPRGRIRKVHVGTPRGSGVVVLVESNNNNTVTWAHHAAGAVERPTKWSH